MEHISKTSGDVIEVVFGQPEEKAGVTEPDGSVLNQRSGPADRYGWSESTKRRVVTCSGIGEHSVTYAARSRGPADRNPIFEDAEGTGARASRTTGGTHDDKSTLV